MFLRLRNRRTEGDGKHAGEAPLEKVGEGKPMKTSSLTPSQMLLMKQWESLMALSRAYRRDPAFRARCEEDPRAVLAEEGVDLPPGMEVRFVADAADTLHVTMPVDPNAPLSEEELAMAGGGTGRINVDSYGCQYRLRWNPGRRVYEYEYNA